MHTTFTRGLTIYLTITVYKEPTRTPPKTHRKGNVQVNEVLNFPLCSCIPLSWLRPSPLLHASSGCLVACHDLA